MSMSDDEPYDADGDVSRFLHCPSPEAHMLIPLSEPEGTLVGLGQYAPPATTDDEVQAGHQQAPQTLDNAAPDLLGQQQQLVPTTEFHGLPAPPQTLNAAPDFGGLQQQAPITGFQGHSAPQTTLLGAPDFGLQHQAPTTGFLGHYPALQTLNAAPDFGLPALPAIDAAAEHFRQEASIMDVDYYPPTMAMDNIQAPTTQTMLAPDEMHRHRAYAGGFPYPTPMHCDGGVDEASLPLLEGNMHLLANGGVVKPDDPSPSLYQQQRVNDGEGELAAIVRNIGYGGNAAASGAAAGAALNDDDVHPVKENVFFRPIIRGQLDCSHCRSVREVVCRDERRKMHLMVHAAASDPGMNFQHAIVDRLSIGPDGHFHTDILLHHDLRGRNPQWVQNFIARSVEMMKRNRGQMQDTCSGSYNCAPAVCTTSVVVAAPPPPSHHTRMSGLQVDTLNNILLSAPPATTSTAVQPAVTQEQENITDAPMVPEAAAPAVVAPQEQQTTDAPGIMETAVPEEAAEPQEQESADGLGVAGAAVPEAAQPAVVTAPQEQRNTDAPPAAAAPQTVQQPPAAVSSQEEENKDAGAGAVVAPFNWEGFQPEILESSLVEPYDPESSANVLLYPSLVEQLRQTELERKESKRLSKMPALDTSAYLEMSDEDSVNEPKLGSLPSFRRLCQRDATYRLYSRRVNCINRKMTKLQQTAARVGARGLFAIKQKMETYKREKAELYDMINKAMEENERRNNNGAGPSNRAAGPSNTAAAAPSNESAAAATSNDDAAGAGPSSNTAIPSSDGAGGTSDDAGPSNAAIPSSDDGAGVSNDEATGPSNTTAIVPSSNCAGPSGSK